MARPLTIRCADAVMELVMSRPDKANALSADLVEELLGAAARATETGIRLIVLRGEGANFCGGFDFTDIERHSDGDLLHRFVRLELLLQAIYHAPVATLALCHGSAFGAGADLVCACDRRLAAPGTRFSMPGPRFGIALGTRRLANRIGSDAALELLSSSRIFEAEEAQRFRFVNAIAAQDTWDHHISEMRRAQRLDPVTAPIIKSRTQVDTGAADLAALVQTASRPGLKERIMAFRAARE